MNSTSPIQCDVVLALVPTFVDNEVAQSVDGCGKCRRAKLRCLINAKSDDDVDTAQLALLQDDEIAELNPIFCGVTSGGRGIVVTRAGVGSGHLVVAAVAD